MVSFMALELLQQFVKAVSTPTFRHVEALPGKMYRVPRQAPADDTAPAFDCGVEFTLVTVLAMVDGSMQACSEQEYTPFPVAMHGCVGAPGQVGVPAVPTTQCCASIGHSAPLE